MSKRARVAIAGTLLLAVGALLAWSASRRYTERRYLADAGPCRLDLDVVERADLREGAPTGSVVLLHGISANKRIMWYVARSFAELGLRVYVPSLPGHGRSPGPFTPEQSEACSLSFVRGLAARGLIAPDRTLLVGHSMGGAIALRIAPTFRPAGVIAISPAPMRAAHGVAPENLLFHSPPPIMPNTFILAAQFEPRGIAASAEELAATGPADSVRFLRVNHNSHVSVLFSPFVARESQAWAMRVLHLRETPALPSRGSLVGSVLGLLGILLISGPFLRELFGQKDAQETASPFQPSRLRAAIECGAISLFLIYLLHVGVPLRALHLFEGDYLASFFLLFGLFVMLLHRRLARAYLRVKPGVLASAAVGGLLLHFLITGWFEMTAAGSWLTLERWTRFPLFFLAAFAFLFAMEILAGPLLESRPRLPFLLALLAVAWLTLGMAVLFFHSGQILLLLLSPYFVVCFLCTGLGAQLVRRLTASPAVAAMFGAILLAGFCLVLFPLS
jgi:pimeloyl-ACP methyl ester carboxylesterase